MEHHVYALSWGRSMAFREEWMGQELEFWWTDISLIITMISCCVFWALPVFYLLMKVCLRILGIAWLHPIQRGLHQLYSRTGSASAPTVDLWLSTRDDCAPTGPLATSGDIFGYYDFGGVAMGNPIGYPRGQRPGTLLNILCSTGLCSKTIIQRQM